MKRSNLAPILGVNRLRMGTDGVGITSLIAFYGCPLNCRFCLNPQCHKKICDIKYSKPEEVYDIVAVDELYYRATGGGVTFGGGEPLMYSDFIIEVLEIGAKKWNVTIETSLNVPYNQIGMLLPYVNEIIVDVKDINPKIYQAYTHSSNFYVIENLRHLVDCGFEDKVTLRVPLIEGYNNKCDTKKSMLYLEDMGYSRFDLFTYKTDVGHERER